MSDSVTTKRYAVLYSDGSFNVTAGNYDVVAARKWLGFETEDDDSQFVEVDIRVTKVLEPTNKKIVPLSFIECPCCKEMIDLEMQKEAV